MVGDESGCLHLYCLRERLTGEPRSVERRESFDMEKFGENSMKQTILEVASPLFEPERKGEKKVARDAKFAYGYFINRIRYHKQFTPSYVFDLIGTKKLEKRQPVLDIQVNRAQSRIYILQLGGITSFM